MDGWSGFDRPWQPEQPLYNAALEPINDAARAIIFPAPVAPPTPTPVPVPAPKAKAACAPKKGQAKKGQAKKGRGNPAPAPVPAPKPRNKPGPKVRSCHRCAVKKIQGGCSANRDGIMPCYE